jgi:hypothetical protein
MKWLGILAFAAIAGCSSLLTAPDASLERSATSPEDANRVRVVGAIAGFNDNDPHISIVRQNANVLVRITTYGDGCFSKGETEVTVDGMVATITPYDYTEPESAVCTMQLVTFKHETTVDFRDGKGEALIRIHGLDPSRATVDNRRGEPIVVERRLVIP